MKYYYFVIASLHVFTRGDCHEQYLSIDKWNEMADYVNNHPDSTWQAQRLQSSNVNKFLNSKYRANDFVRLAPTEADNDLDERANQCEDNGLPKEFDARQKWPDCASIIGHVYDQGTCGSWWAVAPASVFSDRVCIASRGRTKELFSSQQLISCCRTCGPLFHGDACHGGWTGGAFQYIVRHGLVTGGDYKSEKGCQPYLMQPCDHHKPSNASTNSLVTCSSLSAGTIPKCKLHCYNYSSVKKFDQDIIKAKKYYKVSPCSAMNEIYTHGSIVANFLLFEDFFTYKSGVYQQLTGKLTGRHAARVIGWGEENGIPYWLAVNSWNENWGEDGLFKIKRGDREFSFENNFNTISF